MGPLSVGSVRRRLVAGLVALVLVAAGLLGFVAPSADAVVPANGLLHERWDGITGSSIASLTGNAAYPDSPDFSGFLTTEFRTPFPVNNVGQRVRGFYTPPTTGDYIFGVAADDRAELYVSTDMTPANAVLVAHVPFWTGTDQFDKYLPEQQSAAIPLVAGTKYYIEALHKNGANGPGRMSVAAKLVGGLPPLAVIPAADLMPWEDDPGGPVTVWVPVATPSDDAEERPTGQVLRNSSDLEMVVDGVKQVVGIRFASVDVPAGVTIDEAYIQFTTDEATSGTTDLTIEGQLDPNPGTFTTTPFSISTRTRTFADVSWSPGPWTTVGAAGVGQQTEDLKTIVDELIGQGGWASGQSMVFIIEGDPTGKRVAEAYDGAPGAAAVLHITYTPVPPDAISNFVWDDTNGDGLQDGGEPGIDDVTVNLYLDDGNGTPEPGGADGAPVSTTTTAGGGLYAFSGEAPGDYFIEFDPSTAVGTWTFTAKDAGGDDTIDSDADTSSGLTDVFTYSGGLDDTRDAGLYQVATLGNFVWDDTDGDGIQDGGEPGFDGATVRLETAAGGFVADFSTDGGGVYSFTGLAPGSYKIEVSDVPGAFTLQDEGGDDTVDSDVDAAGLTAVFAVSSGDTNDTIDAGFYEEVTISDFVWDDLDLDGEQDALEPGIDGVTVNLLSGGVVVDSEVTAGSGIYTFTGVAPGTYEIEIVVPAGKALTVKDAGGDDTLDSDADQVTAKTDPFAVVSAVSQDTWDFGLVPLIDPPMTGLLWERWTGIPGAFVPNLTSHPDYPASPDITTMHMGDFHIPLGGLNIGDRVRGFVIPSVTDTYTFWVASDVRAEVFLSSDADPANLINGGSPIALVPFWTNTFHWNKYLEQMSAPVALEAGKAYYIEALHKNNHLGNGNFSVGWSRAGDTNIFVIPQANLWIWKGIGDIHIEKVAPGGTGFGFTHSIPDGVGGFSLDDGASESFTAPAGVTFTVTEDDPGPEWQLDSLLCDDPAGSGSVPARTATITLSDGDTVTCTYTNIPTFGSIHGYKFEDGFASGVVDGGLVSVNAAGTASGNDSSSGQVVWSPDGTKIAFASFASDLDPLDTGDGRDVFVRDVVAGTTTLVSVNAAGTASGNGSSSGPVWSPDGTKIAFSSFASDLDPLDTNASVDVFVRDVVAGTTTLVSVNAAGSASGNGESFGPVWSPDGTKVAFLSDASDLDPLDTDSLGDVFVRDVVAGTTTLVSVNAAGSASGNGESFGPVWSPDGTKVAFLSFASDLDLLDTDASRDVFVRDVVAGTTTLVSVNAAGSASGNGDSSGQVWSPDGTKVAFFSVASDLDSLDTNSLGDVFVRDVVAGTTTLVSVNAAGSASGNGSSSGPVVWSPDGTKVAFFSNASDLDPLDTDSLGDVFVRDVVAGTTTLVSVNAAGSASGNGFSFGPVWSPDGTKVAFISVASDLDPLDPDRSGCVCA